MKWQVRKTTTTPSAHAAPVKKYLKHLNKEHHAYTYASFIDPEIWRNVSSLVPVA